mgnify:CR=1 FL=1
MGAPKETLGFQAEVKQVLHLMIHSLYSKQEIFLRELISNASDALDKFRHLTLLDSQIANDQPLEITLEPNESESLLVIRDNGITEVIVSSANQYWSP